MASKTPALTALERAGIAYCLREYLHDPQAESYGIEAAERLGVEVERVFKTLVVEVDGKHHVAIVPVEREFDLRSLGKRAAMVKVTEAERITGYVAGGISPLGQRRRLPTLLDESALAFNTIFVSGGRRGLEIEVSPTDLAQLTNAETRRIASKGQ